MPGKHRNSAPRGCLSHRKGILAAVCCLLTLSHTTTAQLPIARINTTQEVSRDFHECQFTLDDTLSLRADIRLRGETAMSRQKKSFAIKLKDPHGEKCDTSLLGMRKDNYWILDAMAIDVARMRNRVSMDLWNDFSRKPYFSSGDNMARNGTDGKFVELYLDNEYWGLYCLSERIDRKQLRLKKFKEDTMKGTLYKSVSWSSLYSTDPDFYTIDNTQSRWHGWEISYPDVKADEPADWQPLADFIHWLSYSTTRQIADNIDSMIDTPVWQDYFLLMEFICAEDNICKNQYVYYYNVQEEDRKLGVAPWDMDHSWGRDWSGKITSKTHPGFNLSVTTNRVGYQLRKNENKLPYTYAERYAELRTTLFSADSLKNRFHRYFSLFNQTGAAQREVERWSGADDIQLDFAQEQEYINSWIDSRIAFFDQKYNYPNTDAIDHPQPSDTPHRQGIYNIHGQYVGEASSVNTLPSGIYLHNGRKFIK